MTPERRIEVHKNLRNSSELLRARLEHDTLKALRAAVKRSDAETITALTATLATLRA